MNDALQGPEEVPMPLSPDSVGKHAQTNYQRIADITVSDCIAE